MNYRIKKLQNIEKEILDYFVTFCCNHGLSYVLIEGSALGAYRHSGFIPWDDDLDVAMPRKDYNKFLSLRDEFDSDIYRIQDENNEREWFLPFLKIRKQNTLFIESYAEDLYYDNGIYIDVFPVELVTGCGFQIKIANYIRHCLKFYSCASLYKRRGAKKYLMEYVVCLPLRIVPKKNLLEWIRKLCVSVNSEDAKYALVNDDSEMKMLPIDILFPPSRITFEGDNYNAPGKIEEYLTFVYGENFMELPPVEQRRTHEPSKVQF